MKKCSLLAAAGTALLLGAPALAQDHGTHHPAAPAAAAPATGTPAPAEVSMHDRCKAVMGERMDPKAVHDHGRDKTGAATWPGGKRPAKAEMEAMHKQCAAMMAQGRDAPAPTPAPH